MSRIMTRIVVGLCLLLLSLAVPGWSQVQNASLTGLVSDPSGAVVVAATVTARNNATNLTYETKTDSSGYYLLGGLAIGTYTVTAEMTGFKKAIHDDVILAVGERGRNDFQLVLGQITQVVEVKTALAVLQTEQASPGAAIGNTMVLDMPLGRRNWDDLLELAAGVAGDRYTEQSGSTAAGRTGAVNVHGVRSLQNNFLLDGVDNNTMSENVQELSTQIVHESVDAIQEFSFVTDPYSAEYGRSPGGAVNVATKTGGNQFHGTAWEFVRNDKFDAADFFLNRSGAKKAENRQNQFGGNIGGPIVKNRAFFFFNYEGTRIVRGVTRLTNVPLANERSGDFSPTAAAANRTSYATVSDNVGDCVASHPSAFIAGTNNFVNNSIPLGCLDSEAQTITGLIPNANLVPATGPLDHNDFLRVPALLDNNDSYTARADAQVKSNNHVFVRYAYSNRTRFTPGAFGGIIDGTGTSSFGRYLLKAQGAALGDDWVISSRMLNEFRLGWGRNNSFAEQDPFGKNTLASVGILGVADSPIYDGGLPGLSISGGGGVPQPAAGGGLGRLGSPDYLPKFQKTNQFEESDTLSFTKGTHQFKWGADFHFPMRNIYLDIPGVRGSWSFSGQYTGIPWADFLLGYPDYAELSNLHTIDARLWITSFFFQDEWKATPKLSVNYGLRYDYAPWVYSAQDQLTNFNPVTGLTFTPANSPVGRSLVKPDRTNWAPRLGLAYHISPNWAPRLGLAYHISPNWVLRSGYGRFYQLFERIGSEDQMGTNLPWVVTNSTSTPSTTVPVNNMRVATGFNLSLNPSAVNPITTNFRGTDTQAVMPSIDQWNLGFQRLFPGSMVLTVDYVGTKGTHISTLMNLNENYFNPDGTPTGIVPFPAMGSIEYKKDWGNSEYEGLEATLAKDFSHGLTFRAAYTYSHSIDWVVDNLFNGGSSSIPPDTYNYRGTNRGSSDFDVRHQLAVSYVYQIPEIPALTSSSAGGGARALRQILRDWRISGFTTARTGRPFTIYYDNIASQVEGPRGGLIDTYGDCLANGNLPSSQQSIYRWFNTDDYAPPPIVRLGTCGRNTLRGPGLVQFDFNLARSIKFSEARRLEIRWDMLNAFNTTHFGLPDYDVSDKGSGFGQISSLSGDPRTMQFALKFYF